MEIGKRTVSVKIVETADHAVGLLNILSNGDVDGYVSKVIKDIQSDKQRTPFNS